MIKTGAAAENKSQKIKYSFLKIFTGSDLSRRRLPFMSAESPVEGPVVWLTGCAHGDEVGGIVVIQEVFKYLQKNPLLKGAVYSFPLMNPLGFETGSRNITFNTEDLNRSFPGNKNGSLAERIACIIFETIQKTRPALVLDLHNDWMKSIPYTVVDPNPGASHDSAYKKTIKFGMKTGFLTVLDTDDSHSTLSFSLLKHNIPALTLELGESFIVNEVNVRYGFNSVMNILASLAMVKLEKEKFSHEFSKLFEKRLLHFSQQPVSSTSGIIRFLTKPGDIVKNQQPVAKIYNSFGKLKETIYAVHDGIILGHSDSSVAFPGSPIMAFALY